MKEQEIINNINNYNKDNKNIEQLNNIKNDIMIYNNDDNNTTYFILEIKENNIYFILNKKNELSIPENYNIYNYNIDNIFNKINDEHIINNMNNKYNKEYIEVYNKINNYLREYIKDSNLYRDLYPHYFKVDILKNESNNEMKGGSLIYNLNDLMLLSNNKFKVIDQKINEINDHLNNNKMNNNIELIIKKNEFNFLYDKYLLKKERNDKENDYINNLDVVTINKSDYISWIEIEYYHKILENLMKTYMNKDYNNINDINNLQDENIKKYNVLHYNLVKKCYYFLDCINNFMKYNGFKRKIQNEKSTTNTKLFITKMSDDINDKENYGYYYLNCFAIFRKVIDDFNSYWK